MQAIEQSSDQADGLRKMKTQSPVKVIAVSGGKGGVGKTNISVNVAVSLAKLKKRVLLLDADLGLANVDILLGLNAKYNLSDVLANKVSLNDIIVEGPNGIKVIPASSGVKSMAQLTMLDHAGVINAFSEITQDFDYLIIDTAAGISDTVTSFSKAAHENIVVVCDEPTSMTDAYAYIKVMHKEHRVEHFHIVSNMVFTSHDARALFNKLNRVTEQFLDLKLNYLGFVSFDEYLRKSVKQQRAVVEAFPSSKPSREFRAIVDKIMTWPSEINISGQTTFFLERLIANTQAC